MNNENFCPLVSVAVITYNSAKTVVETLESIKSQYYENIELIISDDHSFDNTVSICKEWLQLNSSRFSRIVLLESENNTGISANCNRAETTCNGEWIKIIAGDDLLLPNCISDYISFVSSNPDTVIVFSKCVCFGLNSDQCRSFERTVFNYDFFKWPLQQQFRFLLTDNCIPASTSFYNLVKMSDLGIHFDERIPLLEDWPRWISLIQKGVNFAFLDKETVKYRLNGISSNGFPSVAYHHSLRLFAYLYRYPLSYPNDSAKILEILLQYDCQQYEKLYNIFHSKEYRIGRFILSPFRRIVDLARKLLR